MELIALVAVAALFWGIAPVFAKAGLANTDPLVALAIRSFVISGILIVICAVGGKFPSFAQVSVRDVLFIGAEGVCASLLGHFAYYYAMKLGDVSVVAPMVAAYPVITMLVAILFLGEKMTWSKAAGAAAIIAGVILMKR